jgi:N-acetyl-1-D-myo-inositol-2-amino-2-deoxy-alpha-D-glucopyranoside deacetylase
MPGRSLLVVLAHPDDEIFVGGVMASLSDRGVPVTLVCATCGEAGDVHPAVGSVDDLGAVRVAELRQSCRVLGIGNPILLRFRDSGRDGHRSDALTHVDMRQVEQAVLDVIDDANPQVVLTFDPHGWYYHPDHLAVQRATTAAFFSSGARSARPPERLFYGTMVPDVFQRFADASRGLGIVDGLDPRLFATASESIAVSFDATPFLDRKLRALAAHRTAFGLTVDMLGQPPADAAQTLHAFRPVLERETFILAGARSAVPRWPLADFFDGL